MKVCKGVVLELDLRSRGKIQGYAVNICYEKVVIVGENHQTHIANILRLMAEFNINLITVTI